MNKRIERYSFNLTGMFEDNNGEYVKYKDYENIRSKHAKLIIDNIINLVEDEDEHGVKFIDYLKVAEPKTYEKLKNVINGILNE